MEETHFTNREISRPENGARFDIWTSNTGRRHEYYPKTNKWIIYGYQENERLEPEHSEARRETSRLRMWALDYLNTKV